MSRESIDVKARRYLVEGRLSIEHADAETVRALARGSDAVYLVGCGDGLWACSCSARGRCAHLFAVGLVAPRRAA